MLIQVTLTPTQTYTGLKVDAAGSDMTKKVFWSWSFLSRQGIGKWNVPLVSIQRLGMPK